jgi:RHS repeat-associated protein
MSATYTYDEYGRPITRTNTVADKQVYSLDLTYDQNGIIKIKEETIDGASKNFTYTYDANKQLTGVNGSSTEFYTYDANGNRLTDDATYDTQDRLSNLDGVMYQFNKDGFLSQRGSDTFEYTAQGELSVANLADKTILYTYDGLGRRVGRSILTELDAAPILQEQYLYGNLNEPYQVTALIDRDGKLNEYYYDQSNCLYAIKQGDTWYYAATDQQGSPRVVTNAVGTVIKQMEYDSYGKLISDSNPVFQLAVGYGGGIADPDTKLVHFGMRDYDPEAGRWTARDPILFDGQQGNLYVYVGNNPVNLRDPSGLFCIGGSAYAGFGGGGQFCFTTKGVSVCAEVGFGVGTSVEVSPFGDLARTGSEVGVQGGLKFADIGPSFEWTLNDCGGMKFTGGLGAGPLSKNVSYDFLEKKWSAEAFSIGGGQDKKLNTIKGLGKLSPKIGGSAKLYGRKCLQF